MPGVGGVPLSDHVTAPRGWKEDYGRQAKVTTTSASYVKNKHEDEWKQGIRSRGEEMGDEGDDATGYLPNFLQI